MAAYLTYDTLSAGIQKYIQRTDDATLELIPLWIMLGERRISRDLNILGLLKFIEGTLIPTSGIIAKPNRWLKTNSFYVGYNQLNQTGYNSRKPIYNRENSFLLNYWPDFTKTGLPLFYGDYEYDQWLIVPIPDQPYKILMSYFQVPPLLDATVSTNFLTDYDPDILLAAALREAFMYLKNYSYADEWEKKYTNALQSMGALNQNLQHDSEDVRGG